MIYSLTALFNLLVNPPGDVIYHLVIGLAFLITVGFSFKAEKQNPNTRTLRRARQGGSLLFAFQVFLFFIRTVNPHAGASSSLFVLLIERLLASLTVLWLIWIFISSEEKNFSTRTALIVSMLLIMFACASYFVPYFLSNELLEVLYILDIIWQAIALMVLFTGLIFSLHSSFPFRSVLILILLFLSAGHLMQIVFATALNGSMGAIRFTQILVLPWILLTVGRFSSLVGDSLKIEATLPNDSNEIKLDTKPLLIDLLLKINLTQTDEEKIKAIIKAIGLASVADICYLVKILPQSGKLEILAGYDLIRETFQKRDILAQTDLPMIMGAWNNRQPLILKQDYVGNRDTATISMLIKYHSIGQCLAYPLYLSDQTVLGGVLLLSPYTGKRWGSKTLQMMEQVKETLTRVLFLPDPVQIANQALSQAHIQINILADEIIKLRQAYSEIEIKVQEKEQVIKGLKAKYQIEKMASVTQFDQMNKQITNLSTQVSERETASQQISKLQAEIRSLMSDRERLSLEINRSNALIQELQTQTGQTGPIRLSIDNQIVSLDSITANVKMQINEQLQAKQVDLEIQNPDGRQMIKTDPELLITVILELLSNAVQASKPGKSIQLFQKLSLEMGMLTIQVTDFGEGLTQAEQNAFFSAQYDAIPGIGNIKSLRNAIRAIRVLNGKIWLKSEKSSFTRFRCEIPVRIID